MRSILHRSRPPSRCPYKPAVELLEDRTLLAGGVIGLALTPQFGHPANMTLGPDGNLWFTEYTSTSTGGQQQDHIGRITPSGQLTEFPIPSNSVSTPPQISAVSAITAGPDGNIWFTEVASGKLARITPAGVVTEFQTPTTNASLRAITAGPDGNVWFAELSESSGARQARIGRITPHGVVTEYLLANNSEDIPGITAGPDGNLWFTETGANRIGRITPSGAVTDTGASN